MRCLQSSLAVFVLFATPPWAAAQPVDGGNPSVAAPTPAPPKEPEARRAWLKARLDEILGGPALARAKVSVVVVDPESGKSI